MERLVYWYGILRTKNGKQIEFPAPIRGSDTCMAWQLTEVEGVTACYVDGVCQEGFDGNAALILRSCGRDPHVPYTAIQNHSAFWCRPLFGNDLSQLPKEKKPIQALLMKDGDIWRYYLPTCDDTYKTVLFGWEKGFEFHVYSNCDGLVACENQLAFVYGEGTDPFEVMHRCAKAAATLLHNGLRMREERRMPPVLEYLGWCSWDALQIRVSHEGLLKKAKELREKQVPIRFAIIDDMWADCPDLNDIPEDASFGDMVRTMHNTKMRSFEGDPKRFPQGMQAAISDLKKEGIPYVGIWFPTTGYWDGFTSDGEASEWSDLLTVATGDSLSRSGKERLVVAPETDKAFALYDIFCSRIRNWGADFVKIDNQGFLAKNYQNQTAIGQAARALQTAIDGAVGANFDGALINCMGMPSECMFNRRVSAVSRCSDDFQPESREWFAKNILQCAYNGLLQGQYYINDWDMWWTDDEQAIKNSLCRAISGGPIYVSDQLGRTNPDILRPLILRDGRILRPDQSAVPSADCLIGDPTQSTRPFKLQNRVAENGLVAAFNIHAENQAVTGTVSPADAGLRPGTYAYYEYFTGEAGILEAGETLPLSLANNDVFCLYTFVPYTEGQAAVMGRLDKFIGIRAVTDVSAKGFCLSEGGKVGVISREPLSLATERETLCGQRRGVLYIVDTGAENTRLYYC